MYHIYTFIRFFSKVFHSPVDKTASATRTVSSYLYVIAPFIINIPSDLRYVKEKQRNTIYCLHTYAVIYQGNYLIAKTYKYVCLRAAYL